MMAAFGALRGVQDMRTPLWIAVASNAVNVALDALLIFGLGPLPALGVAGAAWATVASQWLGLGLAARAALRRLGRPARLRARDAGALFVVGRDLFLRTGLLIVFVVLCTRAATRIGTEAGAAHQAIRQIWLLTALVLDSYAATAQSLVGYFLGARRVALARRVAGVAAVWSLGTGFALALAMLAGEGAVRALLVPASAAEVFAAAWLVAALSQPLNALSFVTDGIHWGTRDYRYLRNAMLAATGLGAALLALVDTGAPGALTRVWLVTAVWIGVRTVFGAARVWPGIGAAPLAARST
jgi:MATE family multidrug resistance protein